MTDLLQQLRQRADFLSRDGYDVQAELAAADEIERLEAEIKKLTKEMLECAAELKCHCAGTWTARDLNERRCQQAVANALIEAAEAAKEK